MSLELSQLSVEETFHRETFPFLKMEPTDSSDNPGPLSLFIVIVVIIGLVLLLFFNQHLYHIKTPGHYGPPQMSGCVVNGTTGLPYYSERGTRTIVQECLTNPISGYGCLRPDGTQTFETLIKVEECTPSCRVSMWKESSSSCHPVGYGDNTLQCVPPGTPGIRKVTKTCVSHDPQGVNMCTQVESSSFTGPLGLTGSIPILKTYSIGETITNSISCSDYPNPICGEWALVGQSGATGFQTSNCQLGTGGYFTDPFCQVSTQGNTIFDSLREGYILRPLSCIIDRGSTIAPPNSSALLCGTTSCGPPLANPEAIAQGAVPTTFNPTICPSPSSPSSPFCTTSCRYLPASISLDPLLNPLLTNLVLLRLPPGFIAPFQTPVDNHQLISRFDWQKQQNAIPLESVPLQVIPHNYYRVGCSPGQLEFNSSALFMFGARSYQGSGFITAQIMCLIDNGYIGWLTGRGTPGPSQAWWQQAQTFYGGPGITSARAPTFQVRVIPGSLISTKESGLPTTALGTLELSIRTLNGQPLTVFSPTGSPLSLDHTQALLMSTNTELCSRSLYQEDNCNLFHGRNPRQVTGCVPQSFN